MAELNPNLAPGRHAARATQAERRRCSTSYGLVLANLGGSRLT